jgi:hypothetical protein
MNALLVEFARYQNEYPNLAGLLLGLLKSSAILVMALAAATVLGKRSARARSWIWRTAFLGLGALWLWGALPEETRSSGLAWKVVPMQAAAKTDALIVETPTILGSPGISHEKTVHSGVSILSVVNRFCQPVWWGMAGLLAVVHLAKVLAGGAWLRRNSQRAALRPAVSCKLEIRSTEKVDAPLLAGLLRPAIYVPAAAGDWPEAKMRDVIRHEMAHHSRGDLWWQFSAMMISSLWWGNPLVWTAVRSLKAEAEEAADDVVVQQNGTAEGYARLLVEIASGPIRPASTGISMLGCSPLEKRIRAILAGNPLRGTIGLSGVTLLSSLAAFIILCLSAGVVLAEVDLTNRDGEVVHYQANPEKTVFPQGNFRVTGGTLKDWTGDLDKASSPQRGLVRLSAGNTPSTIETLLTVDPSWKWLTVIARTRPGGEGKFAPDQQGEVIFTPEDAGGQQTGSVITLTDARRDGYTNWTSPMRTFAVPPGTVKLKVSMRLTPGSATFDCSEIFVIPSDATDELDHRTVDRFFDAVKANDAATVESMLKAEPKLANSRRGSNDNGTPLTLCAWKELPEMAALLVKNGASLESEDTGAWRSTPLAWCGWWGSPKTAKVLLEAGANPKFTSDFGVTPLSSAKAGKGTNRSSKATPEDFDNVIALFAGAQK